MKKAIKKGFSFGLTSGVITTLGLIIGLALSAKTQVAVIGGVITIAIADTLSDALGIHLSEESEKDNTEKHIWAATLSTAFYKFVIALTFLIPVFLFQLGFAILISMIWGFFLLGYITIKISKDRGVGVVKPLIEHYSVAILVVVVTFVVGIWVGNVFG